MRRRLPKRSRSAVTSDSLHAEGPRDASIEEATETMATDSNPTKRVLIAGESWFMHTIHQKGFDHFTTTAYGEGHQWLSAALKAGGFEVEHLPNHLANEHFPRTVEELKQYDAVLLSDIGSNTLLLHP